MYSCIWKFWEWSNIAITILGDIFSANNFWYDCYLCWYFCCQKCCFHHYFLHFCHHCCIINIIISTTIVILLPSLHYHKFCQYYVNTSMSIAAVTSSSFVTIASSWIMTITESLATTMTLLSILNNKKYCW